VLGLKEAVMADYEFDIGILGGGSAGLTVAAGAAQFGARTLLIEKEKALGGDCLHYGCVPSKTLIRTAHVCHMMKNAERFGLPRAEMKAVDFRDVAKRIQSVISAIQKHDSEEVLQPRGQSRIRRPGFQRQAFCPAKRQDLFREELVDRNRLFAEIPPIEGIAGTPYITNRDLFARESAVFDDRHRRRSDLNRNGASLLQARLKVTVIQRSSQILSKEDKDMADMVMNVMASEGVLFHLNSAVLNVRDLGSEREVMIKNHEGKTVGLRAEKILIALGRQANLAGLGLEDISLTFDKKGLKLDNRLRTNHKHIFGAGDATGEHLFTHAAGYEGGIVLSNAILHLPRKADYTNLPWCTYTDPEREHRHERKARKGRGHQLHCLDRGIQGQRQEPCGG
jgi:pyruvate/2-oxoglutarate dehydrogenase complex dihydrolipoamide dehydrogenase (E3) component